MQCHLSLQLIFNFVSKYLNRYSEGAQFSGYAVVFFTARSQVQLKRLGDTSFHIAPVLLSVGGGGAAHLASCNI